MRRGPVPGVDLGVYAAAIPLLARNPVIIVIPLLMLVIGVLLTQVVGSAMGGFTGLFVQLLELFGVGAACIMADDAWRHGRASFESGWSDARRRAGDIFMAALGVTLLLTVAGYLGAFLGPFALALLAAVVIFLIWTIPAAAIGGIPGGAAIQISIDRVRATPIPAAISAIVAILAIFLMQIASINIGQLLPQTGSGLVAATLIDALLRAIAFGYIAVVLAKTYADGAFGRRW